MPLQYFAHSLLARLVCISFREQLAADIFEHAVDRRYFAEADNHFGGTEFNKAGSAFGLGDTSNDMRTGPCGELYRHPSDPAAGTSHQDPSADYRSQGPERSECGYARNRDSSCGSEVDRIRYDCELIDIDSALLGPPTRWAKSSNARTKRRSRAIRGSLEHHTSSFPSHYFTGLAAFG